METGKVDWDSLEGDELNVALAEAAGLSPHDHNTCVDFCMTRHAENEFWCREGDKSGWFTLPDYANSIDAQKRDLEPLLEKPHEMSVNWHPSELDLAFASDEWGAAISGFVSFHKKEETARARCLGKALEARKANANVK